MSKKYIIKHDLASCIGCGMCASLCPENWEMAAGGKYRPKKTEISEEELACNRKAEENCPVQAIHLREE